MGLRKPLAALSAACASLAAVAGMADPPSEVTPPPIDYNFAGSELPRIPMLKRSAPPAAKMPQPAVASKASVNQVSSAETSASTSPAKSAGLVGAGELPPPPPLTLTKPLLQATPLFGAATATKAVAPLESKAPPPLPAGLAKSAPEPPKPALDPTASMKTVEKLPEPVSIGKVTPPRRKGSNLSATTGRPLEAQVKETPFNLDDCVECVRMLGASPVDSDREKALEKLKANAGWKLYPPAYVALRRVALTEYVTDMRASAIEMLASANAHHALVADTLMLSAKYDGDEDVRKSATEHLGRLARVPADRLVR
jgi:hypothetical protein